MRINVDANLREMNSEEYAAVADTTLKALDKCSNYFRYVHAEYSFWRLIQDSCQRIVWDAATRGGILNYKHDEPTSFFCFLSISFLLVSHALPCRKPVGLVMCLQVSIYYLRLCRLVLNKSHDREIAL